MGSATQSLLVQGESLETEQDGPPEQTLLPTEDEDTMLGLRKGVIVARLDRWRSRIVVGWRGDGGGGVVGRQVGGDERA
jgi:hypothetical protein